MEITLQRKTKTTEYCKLEDVVLQKGDICKMSDESYAMVVAFGPSEYNLTDINDAVGCYWGDTFKMGTTVAQKNAKLTFAKITEVYKKGEYELILDVFKAENPEAPIKKVKVGDKVKVTGNGSYVREQSGRVSEHKFSRGTIATVIAVEYDCIKAKDNEGDEWWIYKTDFEIVKKEAVRVTAKIGDYVKVTGNGHHPRKEGGAVGEHGFSTGYVGKVIELGTKGDCVKVENPNGCDWYVHHDDYEIVSQPQQKPTKPKKPVIAEIGDRIIVTANNQHGTMGKHGFDLGEVVKVIKYGTAKDRVYAEALDGDCWWVHNEDYRIVTEVPKGDKRGYKVVIRKGKGERECLHGFPDGSVAKVTDYTYRGSVPFTVERVEESGSKSRGFCDITEIEFVK